MKQKIKTKNSLLWLFEPLEEDPRFVQRRLFSFESAYLDGRLYLAVANGKEPWNGLLVCTSHEHHAALKNDFPQLVSHRILGKWLYLSQSDPEFETVAIELVALARRRDPRLGVESEPRPAARVRKNRAR
jgi:hypothetical protein